MVFAAKVRFEPTLPFFCVAANVRYGEIDDRPSEVRLRPTAGRRFTILTAVRRSQPLTQRSEIPMKLLCVHMVINVR